MKRFDAKFTFPLATEQVTWLRQQAATRRLSAADVLRDLIDAERRKEAGDGAQPDMGTRVTPRMAATLRMRALHAEFTRHLRECEDAATTGPCRTCWRLDSECNDAAFDFGMATDAVGVA